MQNTTRKFLIATHGHFARGVKSSLDIIIGQTENVFLIEAYVEENKGIEDDLALILQRVNDSDELVAFTDLLGGSITNQVLRYTQGKNVHIVSGFNLALLIEILLADTEIPVDEVIEDAINNAKQQMVYITKLMLTTNTGDNDD